MRVVERAVERGAVEAGCGSGLWKRAVEAGCGEAHMAHEAIASGPDESNGSAGFELATKVTEKASQKRTITPNQTCMSWITVGNRCGTGGGQLWKRAGRGGYIPHEGR